MTRCVECNGKTKNRSKETMRCRQCYQSSKSALARGRTVGSCRKCGGPLGSKRTITGHCVRCVRGSGVMRPHGPHSAPAWNKGVSVFKSEEHRRESQNRRRRELRAMRGMTNEVIADRIRTLIRNSFRRRGLRKNTKTSELLGCSTAEFKAYLESRFSDGMSWANYGNGHGKWNIDHIIPLSMFDLSSLSQQKLAFKFSNCRPLWAIDNIKRHKLFRPFSTRRSGLR